VAGQAEARLIVLAAASAQPGQRDLGSRADRIARQSRLPVLVVRDPKAFQAWAVGERKLRVVLGADLSQSAITAMSWLNDLTRVGPCEIVLVHLYWPPLQFQRLGLSGVRSFLDPDVDVTRTLRHEFSERLAAFSGLNDVKYRLEPNLGRFDARLTSIALEENADLIVVGSHGRNGAERLWEGSVCRGVLRMAQASVVCVPTPAATQQPRRVKISEILVATDFSEVGNAAIPLAYAIAGAGASVHLVHVIPASGDGFAPHDIFEMTESNAAAHTEATAKLRGLVPPSPDAASPRTMIHVLSSRHPAEAIAQAAERLDADIICLGTHGRAGVTRTLLGSEAQGVLAHTRRVVLLARAPLA
jgi:nucleotide-binding universal stress UspA family protein